MLSRHTAVVVNTVRPSQLVDNTDGWTLFTALDRSEWGQYRSIITASHYLHRA